MPPTTKVGYVRHEGAAVPLQGSEAHQPLQVGLGVDVPLPNRVQLEAWHWKDFKIWQEGVQFIWKTRRGRSCHLRVTTE